MLSPARCKFPGDYWKGFRQMRIRYVDVLFVLALLTMAAPAWGRTDIATLTFAKSVRIGSTTLDPGTYNIRGDESSGKLDVEKDGKTVAQVSCRWVALDTKSPADEVMVKNDAVQQIRFEGRAAAAQVE